MTAISAARVASTRPLAMTKGSRSGTERARAATDSTTNLSAGRARAMLRISASCFSTIVADLRRGTLALTCIVAWLAPSVARAQAVQTWGAAPSAPASASSAPARPPPEPPPATRGTPAPGSASASPEPATTVALSPEVPAEREAAAANLGVVRTPGAIGLKYTLEGVEVRGNTTTLPRVVLRYVPLHAGDVLDVDDPELELTRFRLLGTGFFRDVQLSLRRGTRRGYVVLVVDVVERNTIVVNDVWLGLSEDVEPNPNGTGTARPLTAYGGAAVTETNLAGTGIALGGAFAVADGQLALRARLDRPAVAPHQLDRRDGAPLQRRARLLRQPRRPRTERPDAVGGQDYAVAQYRRFGGRVGFGHDLGISSQIFFDYRLEKIEATLPLAASDHRGLDVEPIDFMLLPGSSILSTLRATFVNDTRDEPFLPTRGASSAPPSTPRSRPSAATTRTRSWSCKRRSCCRCPGGTSCTSTASPAGSSATRRSSSASTWATSAISCPTASST